MGVLLNQLKNEIIADLKFLLRNLANKTRPGAPIRVKDVITFDVNALNLSGLKIKNLSGTVSPGAATSFNPITISVNALSPSQELRVASVEAQVVANPNDLFFFDTIAKIKVSAEADLSVLRIADQEVLFAVVNPA